MEDAIERLVEGLIAAENPTEIAAQVRRLSPSLSLALVEKLRTKVDQFARIDVNQALRIAGITRLVADLTGNPAALARAAEAQAQAWAVRGDYEEALQEFDRAETIYQGQQREIEAARILRSKIAVLVYLDRYEEALRLSERARVVFERHEEHILLAKLDTNTGNIYHRLDQHAQALAFYDRALEVFQSVGDRPAIALVEHNRGNVLGQLNRLDEAMDSYETAWRLFYDCELSLAVAQTEYNMAYLMYMRRDYNGALKLFEKVRTFHLQAGNNVTAALCELDLLEIYNELNLFDSVLEIADSVEKKFEDLQRNYERAKVKTYRALARMRLNDHAGARKELEAARSIFVREGNTVYAGVLQLYLADLELMDWNYAGAIKMYEGAKEAFVQHQLPARADHARLKTAKAKWLASSGRSAALGVNPPLSDLRNEALDAIGGGEDPWIAFQGFHLLGNMLEGEDSEAAYEHYRTAIQCIDRMYGNIQPDELRCSFLKDKMQVYEDMIVFCLRQGRPEAAEETFAYVERAKSRSLVDLLSKSYEVKAKIDRAKDERIYHQWHRVRAELNWLYDRSGGQRSVGEQRSLAGEQRLQEEIRVRERVMSDLLRQLQLKDEEYSSLQTSATTTPNDLRSHLLENEVLVEYFFTAESLKIFVVDKEQFHTASVPVRRRDIQERIERLQFQFEKFSYGPEYIQAYMGALRTAADTWLRELYDRLIEPVQPWIENKHLIIVPHDVLHYIPFHALFDGERYLLERQEVSYAPSASVFRLCQGKSQGTGGRALVLGVPGEMIPNVAEEVYTIGRLFPESVRLMGEEATKEALERHGPDSAIIHLATHGVVRYDNPLFSALKLADTWLNFHDIYNLDLRADIVTLSGCYSGVNRIAHGDELLGLVRGFLYAGAASLLVSLWAVNDRATAELMGHFYSRLKEGRPKRAALREAALAVKEKYDHPYYWAPFVLIGRR